MHAFYATQAAHYHVITQTGFFSVADWRQGGGVYCLCGRVLARTAEIIGEIFSALCPYFTLRRQTRERRGISYRVQTRGGADGSIFYTENREGNCIGDVKTWKKRADVWTERRREPPPQQQLRNSVKHANARVGGGKKKPPPETLDAVKSDLCVTPLATSTSERSLPNTAGDAERDPHRTKPDFMQLRLLKKRRRQSGTMSVLMPLI